MKYINVETLLTEKLVLQNVHDETYPSTDGHMWAIRKISSPSTVYYFDDLSTFAKKLKNQSVTQWGPQSYSEADPAVTPEKDGIPPYIIKNITITSLGGVASDYEAALVKIHPQVTIVGGMIKNFGAVNSQNDNVSVRADYQNERPYLRSQPSKYPIGPSNNVISNSDWYDEYNRKIIKDAIEYDKELNGLVIDESK